MKTKIEKNYCYTGLGFPVELEQVEMVKLGGEWHPKVDVRKVASEVINLLATKDSVLTGNEVRFIRTHLDMSLREFGDKVVHESHAAVRKWEEKGDKPTAMNPNTEFVIRNFIIEQALSKAEKKSRYYSRVSKAKEFFKPTMARKPLHVSNCA